MRGVIAVWKSGEVCRWRCALCVQDVLNAGQAGCFKLTKSKFRLHIRNKFFAVRELRPWHRVPRAAVAASGSLEVSKARLDRAWSNLG